MNKAFIFDMDGVLIDTEREWTARSGGDIVNVFGKDIAEKLGDVIGATVRTEYERAVKLVKQLTELNFRLGIVSSSPRKWIDYFLKKLSFANAFDQIISLNERTDLRPKPEPDGYIEALKSLDANPSSSFILEDSNSGIQAAKASGAFVIGFRDNLVSGYVQQGADVYVDTMAEIAEIVTRKTN